MPTPTETRPQTSCHGATASDTRCSDGADPVACDALSVQLLGLARRVAASECTVLITGESGTGKEVIARYMHRHSQRRHGEFVAVNCAAIPEHMLEAMLFGWERGAFTGAHAAHAGKFEQAQGGTLLLDEISEMPLSLQAKLLRVLQEHEVERLGARLPLALDVRVLATTNRRLREDVAAGRFREDLYYRLNVFPLALTPLRGRRADVLPLAMRLLASHCRAGERIPALDAAAGQRLLAHDWPGNVRELDNVMQRALVLCEGAVICAEHISFEQLGVADPAVPAAAVHAAANAPPETAAAPRPRAAGADLAGALAATEYELILEALRRDHGSRERMAERLGISPRTLRYKLARMRAAGVNLSAVWSAA
ncbi:MAG: sigma-54-dependent Fis family transcriptional regulator [Proteobacteria bacterium]|nr:sigma-54-dependent Fis family transcriptional regulator [Pseudomonadota bacterium]